ncbi:MAG: hypothetical protein AMXMBFR44_5020 [Candidatus Campbellbacteria bacterium]
MPSKTVISILVILAASAGIYYVVQKEPADEQVFCTMDALMCPDGSGVGRSGPDCEFLSCPAQDKFVGELQQTAGGEFQLIIPSPDATTQEVTYVLPLEIRVSNALKEFVGKNVVVYGEFLEGNRYRVETLEEATDADITIGTVALGETKLINRVRITFNSVVSDNRCPIDAVCIQAGSVTANVTLQSDTDKETLNINDQKPVAFDTFEISIVSVAPARMASQPFDETAYRIVFNVKSL